ncbi:acyl-CoA dehydrogenase family protein [Streptomyces ureilyticus]|uniref:Acyl-CoA/acyl-ACP dehydrogenase n=1 Tax=Streptomyces ureilyticus TaxID=1775131 RepID=A0ABX0E217_9ACTN|nr:acyl-CoA dehydrogenase family protein [Streptomyces ureilyticus]NGO48246.1 acyl-CoA/acyl-ACP dehydrogenase [Streptomyces ureilyticus]
MDARFTAEQDEIRRTLRELLLKRCGPEEIRAAVETPDGHDPALWEALAGQLGLPGLALPETYGGVGCSTTELALANEELGRALAPSPLLSTAVLSGPLLLALGTEEQRSELLPRLASGELTAALAVPGTCLATALGLTGANRGDWAGGGRAGGVQAKRSEGGAWRLYGQVDQVLDGHSAGLLLVAAHTGGFSRSRTLLFLVRAGADGLVRVRQTSLDQTRPQARIQLRDVQAELVGDDESADVAGALSAVGDTAGAALAAEAVGAADRVLERTVEYVRQREQFGRAIGSFQAVKHRLADRYVQVQAARSAAYYAAWATAATAATTAPAATATSAATAASDERVGGLALAQALEALRATASEGVQLHGGIGFTWEHEAQLYFKRAAGDELLFGPVHRLRAYAAEEAHLFDGGEVAV